MKNKIKKTISILMISVMTVGTLSACSSDRSNKENSKVETNKDKEKKQETKLEVVKDMAGNDVTINTNLDKVAITHWGAVFDIFFSIGEGDRVVAMADTSRSPWIRSMIPRISEIPDYGSFEDINVEEILNLNPDAIFTPAASPKINQKMLDLGMPAYVTKVEDTHEYYKKELRTIASLLGKSELAEELLKDQERMINLVENRVKDIPEDQRKRVYIMRKDILQKHNKDWQSSDTVVSAGGINVAGDTSKDFDTTAEEVLKWNPDVIMQVIHVEDNDEYYNVLRNDSRFKNIKAIKEGEVYTFPVGANYWYGTSETGLGALLIGKILYPDLFKALI